METGPPTKRAKAASELSVGIFCLQSANTTKILDVCECFGTYAGGKALAVSSTLVPPAVLFSSTCAQILSCSPGHCVTLCPHVRLQQLGRCCKAEFVQQTKGFAFEAVLGAESRKHERRRCGFWPEELSGLETVLNLFTLGLVTISKQATNHVMVLKRG